jgi:S-adenosylmethionine-diacylglycerol 3-amino-3-carboxypropyl transferase
MGNAAHMADVVCERLRKLATGFDLGDNYFAWQAFNRGYPRDAAGAGPLPPYLEAANFDVIKRNAHRASVELASFTEFLARQPAASLDAYVLLDAQDWMGDGDLACLWREIGRTARKGARVVFRTAGKETILPGRVPDALLTRWSYEEDRSRRLTLEDRSAIYGGVHLYVLKQGGHDA